MSRWGWVVLAIGVACAIVGCGGTGPKKAGLPAPTASMNRSRTSQQDVQQEGPDAVTEPTDPEQAEYPLDATLRLNQIQFKGTHNSYHVEPADPSPEEVYTMPPLATQLVRDGVRAFEFDLHYFDGAYWVYHLPVDDQETTCPRLAQCLGELRAWSDAHPHHQPLMVFFDPRDDYDTQKIVDHLDALDAELRASFPPARIVTPDDVVGASADLQAAIRARGWPAMGLLRGKIIFVLWSFSDLAWRYAHDGVSLAGRVMFVAATAPGWRHAMILGMDTAQEQESQIRSAVTQGYLVRTRADDLPGRGGDFPARRDAALRSGAQAVLTDYPAGLPGYSTTIPGGTPSRCNPVSGPADCTPYDVEHPE